MLTLNLEQLVVRRFHMIFFVVVLHIIQDLDSKPIKFTTHNVVTTAEKHPSYNNNNTQRLLSGVATVLFDTSTFARGRQL